MDIYDLQVAFQRKLDALAFDGRTVKPDEIYDPKNALAFRRGVCLLGHPETVGFGNGVYSRADGFYQIDIWIPRETQNALKVLSKAANAHIAHFFPVNGRGLTLTENQTSANIVRHPNVIPFTRDGAYLRQVIEVDFYVDIPAVG